MEMKRGVFIFLCSLNHVLVSPRRSQTVEKDCGCRVVGGGRVPGLVMGVKAVHLCILVNVTFAVRSGRRVRFWTPGCVG
jgi:hypothetical protein